MIAGHYARLAAHCRLARRVRKIWRDAFGQVPVPHSEALKSRHLGRHNSVRMAGVVAAAEKKDWEKVKVRCRF